MRSDSATVVVVLMILASVTFTAVGLAWGTVIVGTIGVIWMGMSVISAIKRTQSYSHDPPTAHLRRAPPTEPVADAPPTAPVADAPPTAPVADAPPTAPVADAPPTAPVADAPPTTPVADAPPTAPVADAPPTTPVADAPPVDFGADVLLIDPDADMPLMDVSGNASPVGVSADASPVGVSGNASPVGVSADASPVGVSADASPVDVSADASLIDSDADPAYHVETSSWEGDSIAAAEGHNNDGWSQDNLWLPLVHTPHRDDAEESPSHPVRPYRDDAKESPSHPVRPSSTDSIDVVDDDHLLHTVLPVRRAPRRANPPHVTALIGILSRSLDGAFDDIIVAAELPYSFPKASPVIDMTIWVGYAGVHRVHEAMQQAVERAAIGWFQWKSDANHDGAQALDIWCPVMSAPPDARYGWMPLGTIVRGRKSRMLVCPLFVCRRLVVVSDDGWMHAECDLLPRLHEVAHQCHGDVWWHDDSVRRHCQTILPDVRVPDTLDDVLHMRGHVIVAMISDVGQFRSLHRETQDAHAITVAFAHSATIMPIATQMGWSIVHDHDGQRTFISGGRQWKMERRVG